ncbi:hypothetical protein CC1G_06313 [Coprinopsis cinerea okayama7|uniref:Sodium/calcium exchanger membrane region domain-containing protein n=1 Tax=Coprinopsis cinerea (strain Okayama-7 / 130 / ATCC MYA-4618 / FGSC 9003) TaxID=240176 RepID=A8NTH2_COPC7|nr:hypothetical protein CC1G_06313 [Coprinopsis cinerea okayama7\|eukprot:XP_001836228.2 hypothetical protein CC1G_06313 [Coprinopsis cinerea okayama7\
MSAVCILALIPLVRLHDLSIAELALRVGGSKTGLLNASMSNFIEIVVAISALRKCELRVVQSSLVGSILSKLLLVLGLCFFAGGIKFSEQGFDPTATQIHSSLLSISVGVLLLPAAYHFTLSLEGEDAEHQKRDILRMSHGVSIVLLFIYISYMAFQLWSHSHLYSDRHNKKSARLPATQNITTEKAAAFLNKSRTNFRNYTKLQEATSSSFQSPTINSYPPPRSGGSSGTRPMYGQQRSFSTTSMDDTGSRMAFGRPTLRLVDQPNEQSTDSTLPLSMPGTPTTLVSASASGETLAELYESLPSYQQPEGTARDEMVKPPKQPKLSWFLTVFLLLTVTMAIAITADWFVESMDGISAHVSKDWVALIVLPLISSVAECITSMRVSVKDELSFSVAVAIGSTIQTALFVIPFMVLLAWVVNKPLTLLMDPFQSLVLYLSVQTTSYVVADGKSNWLEGMILISLYIIIAVAFWFYPGSVPLNFLVSCMVAET